MTDERNLKPEYKQLELLIARGKREARIDAGRLDSILDALALPAEGQEEILRRIDDMGIRIDGRTQFPPGRQPCMEELEEAFCRNEPVLEYLKAIAQAKPLSPEEEKLQADRAARGDTLAGDALVEGNLLRVVSIARDFTGR